MRREIHVKTASSMMITVTKTVPTSKMTKTDDFHFFMFNNQRIYTLHPHNVPHNRHRFINSTNIYGRKKIQQSKGGLQY